MSQGRDFVNLVSVPVFASRMGTEDTVYTIGKHPNIPYEKMFPKGYSVDINPDVCPDIVDDICHSSLISETARGILLIGVYEFLSEPTKALSEIHRILKPHGFLLAALPGKGYWPAPGETGARVSLDLVPALLANFKILAINCFYAPNNEMESCIVFAEKL